MTLATLRRGFSLVEMAILLVIVGLLSTVALVPIFTLQEDDIYKREEEQLQSIRGAILGYAVRHRTHSGAVAEVAADADGRNARSFVLPGARPFLPCPDIDGDGYEDRADVDATGFSVFVAAVTTFTLTAPTDPMLLPASHLVRNFRRCESPRGVLPWRTLGVPPADHWGNLYTYFVDDIFADAQTGFNQNTASDIYDTRTIITLAAGNNHRYALRDVPPLVICDSTDTTTCTTTTTVALVAGQRAEDDFAALFRVFTTTDIVEGVPFAVVSHGKNGLGAADYEINVAARTVALTEGIFCNQPINIAGMTVNLSVDMAEAFNFPVVEDPDMLLACSDSIVGTVDTLNGFMISGQRRPDGFDDLVLWVNRDDLLDAMFRGGALPAPDFPALRPY